MDQHKTKRETVTAALKEYVERCKQKEILSIFGTLDYDPNYDYKRERGRSGKSLALIKCDRKR